MYHAEIMVTVVHHRLVHVMIILNGTEPIATSLFVMYHVKIMVTAQHLVFALVIILNGMEHIVKPPYAIHRVKTEATAQLQTTAPVSLNGLA
jgi:hypothetical protein